MQHSSPSDESLYSPLGISRTQIRLLTLAPSEEHEEDISCHLAVIEFQSSSYLTYEALSYVWGAPTPKSTINVNNCACQVGPNLYTALRHLRRADVPRTLWIDAVCINQTDAAEKDHQIRQMGAIYSHASEVIVWLGESDADVEIAMDMLCEMEKKTDLSKLDNFMGPDAYVDWADPAYEDDSVYPGLNKLFNNPWFSRIWVFQEASLSQKSPIVLCGTRELSFKLLLNLKFFMAGEKVYADTVRRAVGLDPETISELRSFPARWNGEFGRLSETDDTLLKSLLMSTRRRECTEPRDRIFGLLGLLSPEFALDHFPDYSEPLAIIYQRAMKVVLAEQHGLSWLVYAKNKRIPNLPSWCIDFSTKWGADVGFVEAALSHSSSSLPRQKPTVDPGDLDSIVVRGFELARIELSAQTCIDLRTDDTSYLPTSPEEEIKLVEQFAQTICPFFTAVYQTLRDQVGQRKACKRLRSGEIWRLIGFGEDKMASRMRDEKLWPLRIETYLWLIDAQWRKISAPWSLVPSILTNQQLELLQQGCPFLVMIQRGYIPRDAELGACGAETVWLIHRLAKCSLFVASEPKTTKAYYGKANGMVEKGDIVCLFGGLDIPAILRPKKGSFELVAFAHIPSLVQPGRRVQAPPGTPFTLTQIDTSHNLIQEAVANRESREFRLV